TASTRVAAKSAAPRAFIPPFSTFIFPSNPINLCLGSLQVPFEAPATPGKAGGETRPLFRPGTKSGDGTRSARNARARPCGPLAVRLAVQLAGVKSLYLPWT